MKSHLSVLILVASFLIAVSANAANLFAPFFGDYHLMNCQISSTAQVPNPSAYCRYGELLSLHSGESDDKVDVRRYSDESCYPDKCFVSESWEKVESNDATADFIAVENGASYQWSIPSQKMRGSISIIKTDGKLIYQEQMSDVVGAPPVPTNTTITYELQRVQ